MTDYIHNFEGGSDGTTLTPANTGGTSGDTAFTTVTGGSVWTFSSTGKIRGTLGGRVQISTTATAWRAYDQWPADPNTAGRVGFTFNGTVKNTLTICGVICDTTFTAMMKVVTNGAGAVTVQNAAGTTLATASSALVAGTAYYVEVACGVGTTTSNGTITVKLYAVATPGTLLLNYTSGAVNTGTVNTRRGQLGDNATVASLDITYDDVLWRPGTLTLPGPPGTNVPPTADAGVDQGVAAGAAVTLTAAASSDPDGTIASYAWSLQSNTSATTPTLSSATVVSPTYTAPRDAAGSTQTWLLTVTDNSGATATDTVNVTVAAPTYPWRVSTGSGASFAAELVIAT